ncbi:MAG: M23 family metallopeptidase [Candidatus Magasanikbacteria bacterium]|jgi:LysM repeat protein|nr:M23 family metallopeptidase [Candidatus Magasanikbacteria bacterium]MBT4071452.1 M23 family metallopeptidase [Candidatus Magasanikbacteria bacterium]
MLGLVYMASYVKNKILHFILQIVIFLKRFVFFVVGKLWSGFCIVYDVYAKTLGFRIYKIIFLLKRWLQKHQIPLDSRFADLFGKRGILQIGLFAVIVALMVPYSTLYTKDIGSIPGRETLLYKMIGPGDQDFGQDEITVEEAHLDQRVVVESSAWSQGTVTADTPGTVGKEIVRAPQDLSAITSGGGAIAKPTILPGVEIPTEIPEDTTGRRDTTIYVVRSGDVIGKIAEQFGIGVNTILWANNLTARSFIRPGDELDILPEDGLVHNVARGDTVSKIAKTYDTDPAAVVAFNKLKKDGSDIVVGEELFIPGGVKKIARTRYVTRPSSFTSVSAPAPSVSAPAGSGFLWPAKSRIITQYYGWRHTGLDIGGPSGNPLYASKAGTVTKSQCGWNGGYGCYIILDHGGGVQTLYAHASQLYVSVGENVSQGQNIAGMGTTGNSTGNHIHYEVRINGKRQNPLHYVR